MTHRDDRQLGWPFIIVAAAYVAWAALFIFRSSVVAGDGTRYFCLFDDAMISARYAWNLVHGHGLVWNPGEYVEGITNLLWVLVMAPFMAMFGKAGALLAVQCVGLGLMLVNGLLAGHILVNITGGRGPVPRGGLMAAGLVAGVAYYPLSYWALMGMETGLLAVLVTLSVLLAFRFADGGRPTHAYGMAVALGLAFVARPDGALYTPVMFGYCLVARWRGVGPVRAVGDLVGPGFVFVAVFGAVFLFRHGYYGEWLPNTYTLKVAGSTLATRLADGRVFVGYFLREAAPLLVAAALATAWRFNGKKALLAALFVVLLAYQAWNGGDAWFLWRMQAPTIPFLLLLACVAILDVTARMTARRSGAALLAALLVALAVANQRFLPEVMFQRVPSAVAANAASVSTALALDDVLDDQATIGVFWAGAIPYFTERYAIDFLGKADKRIAALPPDTSGAVGRWGMVTLAGHNKYDLEYSIKELRPTYIQGFNWGRQNLMGWVAGRYRNIRAPNGATMLLDRESPHVRWERLGG
ncbi:MAG: hypothetical protein HZA24_06940 [Nitrospirae bacterium]|nr:hypothetical protein [Nitrospirota bacterium]